MIHITPKVEELLQITQVQCTISGCQSVFKNNGNLQMHLRKHHKLSDMNNKDSSQKLYFCPQPDCIYYKSSSQGKYFKYLKLVKQHFQKVHADKKFVCSKCSKKFGTQQMKDSHEKSCGKDYTCTVCGWTYNSSEALLTHAKRRKHNQQTKVENSIKIAIPSLKQRDLKINLPEPNNRETQTENNSNSIVLPPKKRMKVIDAEINNFQDAPLCDIETQTELNFTSGLCDPMLYSNSHTQTCDEYLSELGLTNIQTQTNWSAIDEDTQHDNERNGRFSSGAHDELMVSTETQTSFTQCLLDSCNEENSLTGCITQHTQTCDTLLEGLFGGQENDLIGSFQSTHTQT